MIVVTGAAGFLGSALVRHLAKRGFAVTGIDRRPAIAPPGGRHIVAELTGRSPDVRRLLDAADVVVHLAARPGVRDRSPRIELIRHRDNVLATRDVLDAVRGPLIVASSSSVYGGSFGGRASHEDDALAPIGGYARSKATAEELCTARRDAGHRLCVVRPFTVVGPGQRADMAIDRWLRAALAGRPIEVFGGVDRTRDVTDVRDITRALAVLVEMAADGAALPGVLNLGTGRAPSLGELAAAVRRAVPGSSIVATTPPVGPEPEHTRADTRRCAATLGFVPATDLDDVVARQLAHLTWSPLRVPA